MEETTLTLEKVKSKNLEKAVIDGKKIKDCFVSDQIYKSGKIVYGSGFGRCVWGQCNYSRG